MSIPIRNSVLIAGLGRNADPSRFPIHQVEEVLAAEAKKLRDAGLHSEHIDLDPKDVEESMRRLKDIIATRNWDAFQVGFAVRGVMESTEVFEKAVNTWIQIMPGKKMIFPQGPLDIAAAAIRTFGPSE